MLQTELNIFLLECYSVFYSKAVIRNLPKISDAINHNAFEKPGNMFWQEQISKSFPVPKYLKVYELHLKAHYKAETIFGT